MTHRAVSARHRLRCILKLEAAGFFSAAADDDRGILSCLARLPGVPIETMQKLGVHFTCFLVKTREMQQNADLSALATLNDPAASWGGEDLLWCELESVAVTRVLGLEQQQRPRRAGLQAACSA